MKLKKAARGDPCRRIIDFAKLPISEDPQTLVSYDPNGAVHCGTDGLDVVIGKLFAPGVYDESAVMKAIESFRRADPKVAVCPLSYSPDRIVRKPLFGGVSGELAFAGSQEAVIGANPNISFAIGEYVGEVRVDLGKATDIKSREPDTVKSSKILVGCKPKISVVTLGDLSPGWRAVGYRPRLEDILCGRGRVGSSAGRQTGSPENSQQRTSPNAECRRMSPVILFHERDGRT